METSDKGILIILAGVVSLLASLPTIGKDNLALWTYSLIGLALMLLVAIFVRLRNHPWLKQEHGFDLFVRPLRFT